MAIDYRIYMNSSSPIISRGGDNHAYVNWVRSSPSRARRLFRLAQVYGTYHVRVFLDEGIPYTDHIAIELPRTPREELLRLYHNHGKILAIKFLRAIGEDVSLEQARDIVEKLLKNEID